MKRLAIYFLCLQFLSGAAVAATAEPLRAPVEIGHLLDYVEQSRCQFNRNGTWYDGATARRHLQGKYDYLAALGEIDKAEDFIAKAATQSSASGRAYQIKCGDGAAEPSGPWLTRELMHERQAAGRN